MEKNQRTKTMDGNAAAAHVAYAFSEVAAIFPITPSSPMAETVDAWSAEGKKNMFDQPVCVVEMQSEAGAAGTVHGALQAGALTTTFTSSQGLLLMIPNMYNIAGELLPAVFHVAARTVGTNAKSIFCDHSDVMATRQTGFAMLCSSSVQDVMNLGAVAHLAAIKGRIPFVHFFDGFRTSHEIQKVSLLEKEELKSKVDLQALEEFRHRGLNPDHPDTRSVVLNPDVLFQARESVNRFYLALPDIVEEYMQEINELTGENYHLFDYYGAPDAERVIISMGSSCQTIMETVDALLQGGEKVGMLNVRLFRPFSVKRFLAAIPGTVKKIAVLDRCKEPGSIGEPLLLDVQAAYSGKAGAPLIIGGRYGLGSKEFLPSHVAGVFQHLDSPAPSGGFTVGILDDVTGLSLTEREIDVTSASRLNLKFWGYGSDGTVGANKTAVKMIGDHTSLQVQAYFSYDTKKSGGLTISHLRFDSQPIRSEYFVTDPHFVACHNQAYVDKYDLLKGLRRGGIFLLNCRWTEEELEERLPAKMKRYLAQNEIQFYIINAGALAEKIGMPGKINMVMLSAFFRLNPIIPLEQAVELLKKSISASYGKQGSAIVEKNHQAIELGIKALHKVEIPGRWAQLSAEERKFHGVPEFVQKIMEPMNRQEGDSLPVSAFLGREDGSFPNGTSAYEKRGVASTVPKWDRKKCIQCNQCAFVCPHAVIRPVLLDESQVKNAPADLPVKEAVGYPGASYHLSLSPLDCTGCANCVDQCPKGALAMSPLEELVERQSAWWEYTNSLPERAMPESIKHTVKGSQFVKPLLEFSGSCAGCVQTVYAKLLTQLFGDRMMIANPAGCTGAWASAAPSFPYALNEKGHGPAWASSLFEDNAEYGYGMILGVRQVRTKLKSEMEQALQENLSAPLRAAISDWLEHMEDGSGTRARAERLKELLSKEDSPRLKEIYGMRDFLIKRSQWLVGGDGWAYDIGFGGLDHVLSTGEDINAIVFDTEVYSNTGGQSSKATPTAAIAKFAAGGKRMKKKDLGLMAMSYGNVYVAQISIGADKRHALEQILKAEAYPGPSLIIAYCPCINHGIKAGMGKSIQQSKKIVECGLWPLYHYDPTQKERGESPFKVDTGSQTGDFMEYIQSEVRFDALRLQFPGRASELYEKARQDCQERTEFYQKLEQLF